MLSTLFLTAVVSHIYNYDQNNSAKDLPTDDLIIFINKNINNSDLLRTKTICKVFGFSESYFGRFFKASYGLTFQNYIITTKIKMIKIRANFSDMLMSEIAEEVQFSDSSHLNKFFRKVVGVNLNVYKSQVSIKTLK